MNRHRRFQVGITIGVTATTVVVIFWPEYQVHAAAIGLVSNLCWIWE